MKKCATILLLIAFLFSCSSAFAEKESVSPDRLKSDVSESIGKGLEWLLKQQNEDGSFGDEKMNPAYTALAVASIAKSPLREEYIKTPKFDRAVEFVLSCVKEDGEDTQYEVELGTRWRLFTSWAIVRRNGKVIYTER